MSKFFRKEKNPWARVLAYNSSYRSQNNVSTRDYTSSFQTKLEGYRTGGASKYATDYLSYRYLDVMPPDDEAYCNIMHFEGRHPLVDQYSTFVRLLSARAAKGLEELEIEAICDLSLQVSDPYIHTLAGIASRMQYSTTGEAADRLRRCSDYYLEGKFREAKSIVLELLESSPTDFIYYDIAASTSARLNDPCPKLFHGDSVAQALLHSIFDWYASTRARHQSLEDLRRLGRALHSTRLGPALLDFVNNIDDNLPPLGHECIGFLASPFPLPHTALTYNDTRLGQEYLHNYCNRHGETAGTRVIDEYLRLCWEPNKEFTFHSLSESSRLRYRSAALLSAGEFGLAVKTLSQLRNKDASFVRFNPELYAGEAFGLFELGKFEKAATLMADIYCEDAKSVPPALFRRFSSLLSKELFTPDKGNVSWPILATATLREEGRFFNTDRVHDFVGDYIESNNCTRPTELLTRFPDLPSAVLTFLLECCKPEIFESSIWYSEFEEVLRERLILCSKLHEYHQIDKVRLSSEIAELTRRIAIMDITNRIERSRIYVDTAKIIELVDDKTLDQTDRLLMLLALKDRKMRMGIRLIMLPSAEGGRVVVVDVDECLTVFQHNFETLKKEFLYSPELGLDANLSQSVRHRTCIL